MEERSMDDYCHPVKRRKTLHSHIVNHSESNIDLDLPPPNETINSSLTSQSDISNTEVLVNHDDKVNDGEESLMEGSQIDLEQESYKNKNKFVIDEPKLDAIKESDSQVMNEDNLPPEILGSCGQNGHSGSRKKLLVLDVNGLLVDIVAYPDEAYKPDTIIGSKAVFKRPYCDEFLKFCFERFNVGVWTSRTRRNIERVLDFLMRDTQHKLLFCWDQSHCTETGFNTIENSDKPLVLKELKKLWEKQDPNLPWNKGVYNESNTLLLDDSPYKALQNPPYTAIFPDTYRYRDTQDNGLGPDGDLRTYLEKLAASDNVQIFIEQNPFGQPPITYNSESWKFYRKVINATSSEPFRRPRKKLIVIDARGLLVDVVAPSALQPGYRAHAIHGSRAVFKRPYCDEFLQFCFEKFEVGVWTSTHRIYIERALDFLMRDAQHKLLFCWDETYCTDTGFYTVENYKKPLILKELRKLWKKQDPNLPWNIGEYDESNTLLLDNSPHKALLNPPHTAIFPYPYRYWQTEDNSLGPKGNLRVYLERLAASENVQKFVEENPFGQRPIREKNLSWGFYQKVINAFSSKSKNVTSTASAAPALLEPKTNTATDLAAAPTLLEAKTNTATDSAAPTLLEPDNNSATDSDDPTLLEPESDATTDSAAPILLEPKTNNVTVSADPTLLESKTVTATGSAAPMLMETKTDIVTDSAAQILLETETNSTTVSVAPSVLEPETDFSTKAAAPILMETETNTVIDSAAPILLETETNPTTVSVAPTLLEPEPVSTTNLTASTLLEPKTDTCGASAAPTLSETESDNTASVAQTLAKFITKSG